MALANATAYKTFIVQSSLTIITYDSQNIFIAPATGGCQQTRGYGLLSDYLEVRHAW